MNRPKEQSEDTSRLKPNDQVGPCIIETVIDEDKQGTVYKAFHEVLAKPVALKILSPDLAKNSSFADVLRIQMQTASSVKHPGIAEVYEIGILKGCPYIISEWSPDGWLSQQFVESGKFTVPEAVEMMINCAEALQAVVPTKIFHGNLRLNSILLFPGGKVKITEIGLAAAVRALYGASDLSVYLGTARFLAPEMGSKDQVDHRADIYSLGLILYFLLFSTTPFRYEGEKLTAAGEKNDFGSIDEVLKVISKMTETQPSKRYQDYESLLDDLRGFLIRSMPDVRMPVIRKSIGDSIKNQKLFRLLCVLYASGANGTMITTADQCRRVFYVRNREIIYFESNQPEEDIWNVLVEKREIDASNRPSPGESFARTLNRLAEKDLIRLEDFRFRYQELANRTVSEALKSPNADAEFLAAEIEGDPLCIVRLSGALLKAARYNVDLDDVLSEIKSNSFLYRTGLFDSLASSFSLTPEESLLVTVSQEGIYTGSLEATPGSSNEKGLRFLFLLKMIGALEMKTSSDVQATVVPERVPAAQRIYELDETPSIATDPKKDSVRMEVQRTAVKAKVERLDLEAERRFEQAKENYKNMKYWDAAQLCEQALSMHEDGKYYWLMGMSYAQHPKFRNKAEDCFHRAINLDPLNDDLHVELAEFYVIHGLFLRARTHCQRALAIIPDQPRATEMLATVLKSLGSGGCCCEHDPGCNHEEHKAWRLKR